MTEREIRQLNRAVNSTAFLRKYETRWIADSRPAKALVRLPQIIARLTDIAAQQAGGQREQEAGTATKAVILKDVRALLKRISRTAELVATDTGDPDFAAKFAPLDSVAAERVIAVATDFNQKIGDQATWQKFLSEGMADENRTALGADLVAYPTAREGQAAGRLDRTGATDELDDLVHEGMAILDSLDTYFDNFFAQDKLKLAEWRTASRLERAPQSSTPIVAGK